VYDGDTVRTQVWHYPGRTECLECHTGPTQGGLALGFNTAQLNRDFLYPNGVTDNQLRSLQFAGYFSASPAVPPLNTLRALAHPTNETVSVEQRVRSYLAANCAFCHQPGGSAQANFDARLFRALPQVNLVNGPLVNPGGNASNRVVVPGSLDHSMLLARISIRGAGQMPPRASTIVDTQAVALLSRWITNDLAAYQSFADWQIAHFGSTNAPAALSAADPDGDRGRNGLEYLTGTDPQDAASAWGIGIEVQGESAFISYPRLPNRGFEVQWRANSDFGTTSGWQFLDVPENRPFFSATNGVTRVPVSPREAVSRFYRVRVYEP
ncbi:MAG TPA: hypothetical protein VNO52_03205, partial [Methylomirabilota bacterium]|nr:hypothetical protein [Methylomirabilota bacterium]